MQLWHALNQVSHWCTLVCAMSFLNWNGFISNSMEYVESKEVIQSNNHSASGIQNTMSTEKQVRLLIRQI